jgi:hypothetical protein
MSDRLEYLRNCTQEEREDEGTQGEYEELEELNQVIDVPVIINGETDFLPLDSGHPPPPQR